MTGYPYFYKNEKFDQDKNFMIFSLKPIKGNLLTQVVSLSVLIDNVKLELGDEFAYEFCDQISKVCGKFRVIPETQALVLDYNGFCQLASDSHLIMESLSYKLGITKDDAMQQAQDFFKNKNVIVQASGVQGALYKVGSYLQSAGSAGLVVNTLATAKLAGISGLQIIKAQPMLVVAIPITGSIFFYGCGAILGNNHTLGKAFVTTGDLLALPMKGVEIMWNSYGNPVIQKIFGIPIILNMTKIFKTGPGYTIEEISRYIPLNNKSILKTVKKKIIDWLS
jgi:uncharacterized membrane protein (UPF0136 family)